MDTEEATYFIDRVDAGEQLADVLAHYAQEDCVIFALPHDGMTIGRVVAERLHAPVVPLDVKGDELIDSLAGKTVILVDDGLNTGKTMHAAVEKIAPCSPTKIIIAVPVAEYDALRPLRQKANDIVALNIPQEFAGAIDDYYREPVER